jgi:hypothetical protein
MCDLIVLASRLSLLQIHRRRKARLISRSASGMTVLQPVLQILQYHSASEAVRPVLDQFAETLSITFSIQWRWAASCRTPACWRGYCQRDKCDL